MLHYRTAGEGRPLVIVHGLFGSGDNWLTLAGKFPGFQVCLPDLRNHGSSPWFDTFSHADLAADLHELQQTLSLGPCPWIGHSLGAKAVMELALRYPGSATGIAALDATPKAFDAQYPGFVQAMKALDLHQLASRGDAQTKLEGLTDRATLQFLLKSLVSTDTPPGWRWKLNLDVLETQYGEIWKPLVRGRSWDGPALFLYGGASEYYTPGDEALAAEFFPRAVFHRVEGAGHWLHAEKPAEVLAELNAWLASF